MSIFDRIGRQPKRGLSPDASLSITQRGSEKLATEYKGDYEGQALVALEGGGTKSIDEIARQLQIRPGQAENIVNKLVRKGYVQVVNSSMGELSEE